MGFEIKTYWSNSNISKHSNKNAVLFLESYYFYSNQTNEKQNMSKLKSDIMYQAGFELSTSKIHAKHPMNSAIKPAMILKGVYLYINKDNEYQIYY